jgi:hypothetical protein
MAAKSEDHSSLSLEEVLIRQAKPVVYEEQPTHIEGVSQYIEKGKNPALLRRQLGKLATSGKLFHRRKERMAKQAKLQVPLDKYIKDTAAEHRGFNGIVSEKDKFKFTVFPSHEITWDPAKLKESLGETLYPIYVHENKSLIVSLPLGAVTTKGAFTSELANEAIQESLTALGFSTEDIEAMVTTTTTLDVDAERLGQLISRNQLTLVEGTGVVKEGWTLKTDTITP